MFVYTDISKDANNLKVHERGVVYEHVADFNNILAFPVHVILSPPADLEPESFAFPNLISVGESFTFNFTIVRLLYPEY